MRGTNNMVVLIAEDLKVGHFYKAKHPQSCGLFPSLRNDRQIVWMDGEKVQYDSPSVKMGRLLPYATKKQFLKWVKEDVTEQIKDGYWVEI